MWIFILAVTLPLVYKVDPFAFSPQRVVGFIKKYHHKLRNEKLAHDNNNNNNNNNNKDAVNNIFLF